MELLVAVTLSLVIMAAVASLFSVFSRTVSDGRAIADLSSRMRNTAWRLRQDLAGLTCVPSEVVRVEASAGYFHVIEGPLTTPPPPPPPAVLGGDVDDVLALTTTSPGAPFTGRLQGAQGFESPTAEVIWFCELSGVSYKTIPLYNLHRRQLLVAPTPDVGVFAGNVFADKGDSDLSYGTHLNSLADLSKPATRFLTTTPVAERKLTGNREGEDVLLGNVIAFDVRIVQTAGIPADQDFETRDTRENGAPEAGPLRGIEVRIRVVEPSTGQIREVRVVHSFGVT